MGIALLTPDDAVQRTVRTLGLDSNSVDLTSPEVLAASVRRAASFLCPITPGLLARSVDEALVGLPGYSERTRAILEETVDALVSYGDLLELPVEEERGRHRYLYLGPPAFVQRQSGVILLLGVRPDGAPLLPSALSQGIEYEAHVRLLPIGSGVSADDLLAEGLMEMRAEQWLRCPRSESASRVVEEYTARLSSVRLMGPLDGVRVLDPARPPTYYRGRWRELTRADTGTFVARRPQGYGADPWCFLEVGDGEVLRGIDLPVTDPLSLGADEAWRLQAAIDAERGQPQRVAIRRTNRVGWSVIDLFSPIPSWAQRRLDIVGKPVVRSRGALLSYAIPTAEVPEEVRFLERMMWLSQAADEGSSDG